MGFYNYAVPTLSVPDPSALFLPNQRNSLQVTWGSATETSLAKTLKSPPDRLKKSGETNNKEAKVDGDNKKDVHIDDPPPTQDTSASTNTSPSSDSPENHTD